MVFSNADFGFHSKSAKPDFSPLDPVNLVFCLCFCFREMGEVLQIQQRGGLLFRASIASWRAIKTVGFDVRNPVYSSIPVETGALMKSKCDRVDLLPNFGQRDSVSERGGVDGRI